MSLPQWNYVEVNKQIPGNVFIPGGKDIEYRESARGGYHSSLNYDLWQPIVPRLLQTYKGTWWDCRSTPDTLTVAKPTVSKHWRAISLTYASNFDSLLKFKQTSKTIQGYQAIGSHFVNGSNIVHPTINITRQQVKLYNQ